MSLATKWNEHEAPGPRAPLNCVDMCRRDATVLVAHIAPVLALSVTLNIPKFLESEVSKNGDDDDDDDDDVSWVIQH